MSEARINVSSPEIDVDGSLNNIRQVLESGQLAQGRFVQEAEELLAKELEAKSAALVNNGTSSLRAAICAGVSTVKNIQPAYIDRELAQSEIVVPAFSFNATLNAALQLGTNVRMVDVEPYSFNINSDAAGAVLNDSTLAVVPVDLYGQPADTRGLSNLLAKKQIALVRDSAQAHGATIDGKSLSEHGDAISLSFYATKNINSGEGGAVVTNNSAVDEIVRMYRNQGMRARYQYDMVGDNLRMSELHAAILITQLGKIATNSNLRQVNAQKLNEGLKDIEGITTPRVTDGMGHVYHQYTIMVEPEFGINRDQLAEQLDKWGIGTGVYYPKIMTEHDTYKDHPRIKVEDLPAAREVAGKVLSLPVHTRLSEQDINRVYETIKKIQSESKNGK